MDYKWEYVENNTVLLIEIDKNKNKDDIQRALVTKRVRDGFWVYRVFDKQIKGFEKTRKEAMDTVINILTLGK